MLNNTFCKTFILLLFSLIWGFFPTKAQNKVYVDSTGILRWTVNNEEAAFFGVNYAAPFAHAYRSLKKMGIDIKKVIDTDVEHLARLEFNAYRIHVWDREVSDLEGNLLDNEHIELLDYLIHKLKQKGIYVILTPIAWWGTGWPEPDVDTPGFSTFYSKVKLVTEAPAREAQKNYLKQFVNHINRYDNVAYKNDTSVIAFEIINEPNHPSDNSLTTAYINEMAAVLRNEGITKPIYYNISENWPVNYEGNEEQVAAVYNANIDGITFQWYPTGLVKRSELKGSYLSHVEHYPLPDIKNPEFLNKTRMVYEFDAADKSGSYMYPSMARSFKEAGMQWATMFCYDPYAMAANNTEYQTHYLNLLYTPQKAISMLIAANIFKDVKAYTKFSNKNINEFGDYKISYTENLSQLNSDKKFYYSNNTSATPKNINTLEHIAGYGSSPVVQTNSRGAYFLDKITTNTWILEIYTDAVWLTDPFGVNSLDRKVATLFFSESEYKIVLPGLDSTYYVYNLANMNNKALIAKNHLANLKPGKYLISSSLNPQINTVDNTYILPDIEPDNNIYVLHNPPSQLCEGSNAKLSADVFSETPVKNVQVKIRAKGWQGFSSVLLTKKDKYNYSAELPGQLLKNGVLEYCIVVYTDKDTLSYPGGVKGEPGEWDFKLSSLWQTKVAPADNPLVLFHPEKNYENLILPGIWDRVEYTANVIFNKENEPLVELKFNKFKKHTDDITFQIEFDDIISLANMKQLSEYQKISFTIYSDSAIDTICCRLVTDDGRAGSLNVFNIQQSDIEVPLTDFKDDTFVLLPRPYPRFLPYYYNQGTPKGTFVENLSMLNFIQISIPASELNESNNGTSIRIGKIELRK